MQQQFQAQQQGQQQQQQQYQPQQQQAQPQFQPQQEEVIEENIYDFGGVHVKSCATIALKKSIERGMVPPNVAMRSPSYESNPSGPSSLENRPPMSTFKQPCPGIASRMMIFQQGSQTMKPPQPQMTTNPPKPFPNPNYFTLPAQSESMIPQKEPQQVRNIRQVFFLSYNFVGFVKTFSSTSV